MKNKIFITLFLLIILISNISFASYETVTMQVTEEPICTIPIGEKSKFEKKLIKKDLTNKEVTLQLQVTVEDLPKTVNDEVIFVLDNSNSMQVEVSDEKTRKDLIFESVKSMISNLLKDTPSLQIGIVSFSTNTDISKEGTIADANVVSKLTNNVTTLNTAIDNIDANGARTDLQSGLLLASQQFSKSDNNKYMIVLTDGVPNVAINYNKQYYSDDVIQKTVAQLKSISEQKIKITTMLTKVDDEYIPAGVTKSFGTIIKEIFGTTDSPTVGKFYYVEDTNIEKTVKEDIFKDFAPKVQKLKNIKIVDYFPKEIINNFEFSYVSKSNIGTISPNVDTKTNSITWTIPEIDVGKTATVQYKLKLKKNYDSAIVDKILNTNEKQSIDYTNFDEKVISETSTISPKLKLTEPNIAPTILPQTGSFALAGLILFSIILVVLCATKFIIFYKNTH